jgi:hypothetical protein
MQAILASEKVSEKDFTSPEEDFAPITEVFMVLWGLEKEGKEEWITKDVIAAALSQRYTKKKTIAMINRLIEEGYCLCKHESGKIPAIATTKDGREAHRQHCERWEKQKKKLLKRKREM